MPTTAIQLRALTIGRDFGTSLEVLQGLSPDDWVVINPPDSIENNQEVRVQTPPAPAGPATQAGKTGSRP